jgi:glycosyltransferase involved in cell wall biosynthesis
MRAKDPMKIAFVSDSIGFPYGMAATSRVRLLARSLVECGAQVTVFCTQVSERLPEVENVEPRGEFQGIRFEYTTGCTTRAERFLTRRIVELKSVINLFLRLFEMKRRGELDCIYAYTSLLQFLPAQRLFLLLARLLRVPVVGDFCEPPWTLLEPVSSFSRMISPLAGLRGAVVISHFLEEWVQAEAHRLGKTVATLYIPILVDVNEKNPSEYSNGSNPVVMFAGSPGYNQTIGFILDAMPTVWAEIPQCQLVISGFKSRDPGGNRLIQAIQAKPWSNRVELIGYVSREELLNRYAQASALLIPLFDDIRSRARFPTKIGEYLASGRPIITTSVGEISHYFLDGQNAFICAPGDPQVYGKKIVDALRNPIKATQIGHAGRETAEKNFHYEIYREAFFSWLDQMKN